MAYLRHFAKHPNLMPKILPYNHHLINWALWGLIHCRPTKTTLKHALIIFLLLAMQAICVYLSHTITSMTMFWSCQYTPFAYISVLTWPDWLLPTLHDWTQRLKLQKAVPATTYLRLISLTWESLKLVLNRLHRIPIIILQEWEIPFMDVSDLKEQKFGEVRSVMDCY